MLYRNKKSNKRLEYKLFSYSGFEGGINTDVDKKLIPLNVATNSYNFCYKNGVLSDGMGVSDLKIKYDFDNVELVKNIQVSDTNPNFLKMWNYDNYFAEDNPVFRSLIFYGEDGYIYAHYMHANVSYIARFTQAFQLETAPKFFFNYHLNGQAYFIFITADGEMKALNMATKSVISVTGVPTINSYCIHNNRMYVTDANNKNLVWFSHEDDPTNWQVDGNDCGNIEFRDKRGSCLKVVAFEDYVYVIREYGISRITAHKQQNEPEVENMYLSSSAIIADTICVCGDKILFMTSDGLYSFNGNTTSKMELKVNNLFKKITKILCAQFSDNSYYLACKLNFNDGKTIGCESVSGYTTNALIRINLYAEEVCVMRGVDIVFMNAIKDIHNNFLGVIVNENGRYKIGQIEECGKKYNSSLSKYWCSGNTDFGIPNKKKLFNKIYINTLSNATITLNIDGVKYEYELLGSDETSVVAPNISGYNLCVEIKTEDFDTNISAPKIMVGCLC